MIGGMARLRVAAFLSATTALGFALTPGCRDATQITLEISLGPGASCAQTNGTAITVGTEPLLVEQRVSDEAVTTVTPLCNAATGQIGTLVLTPDESGRAS